MLRGRVRQLEKELRYYRRRAHLQDDIINGVIEDAPVQEIHVGEKCPVCKTGILHDLDLNFLVLQKCDNCEHKVKKK